MRNPNVTFFVTTTSYTYHKIHKNTLQLCETLQKFHHGKIRLAVEFEIPQLICDGPTDNALVLGNLRQYRHK